MTRDAGSEAGAEITIEGGRLVNVTETGAPAGTLVEVRQLFYNTPARRKFLKSVATEMAHIADILAGMALAWPQVQFRLTHNERVLKNWPAAADPFERAVEVLGGGLRDELHAIALSREGLSVSGWVSSPRVRRTSSNGIFILVNRRWVRDRVAQHALFQGYSQRLVKGQFPLAVLFIAVPSTRWTSTCTRPRTKCASPGRTTCTSSSARRSRRPCTTSTGLVSGKRRRKPIR